MEEAAFGGVVGERGGAATATARCSATTGAQTITSVEVLGAFRASAAVKAALAPRIV